MTGVRWLAWLGAMSGLFCMHLYTSGCGDCTDIGCNDVVIVHFEADARDRRAVSMARACVDRTCRTSGRISIGRRRIASVRLPLPNVSEAAVSVTLHDERGRIVLSASGRAPVATTRPNGPDCPPECRRIAVRADGERLVPAEP